MQEAREAFVAWLQARAAGGVCVVGNAGSVLERPRGAEIDAHAVVLRFNRWQPPGQDLTPALGHRLDVWVAAPDCRALPLQTPAWAVITGADPLVAMEGWPQVQALRARGVPVLTVPLGVWRALVDRLGAPPSAGALVLAWLTTMGLGQGLHMTGIAETVAGDSHVLGAGTAGAVGTPGTASVPWWRSGAPQACCRSCRPGRPPHRRQKATHDGGVYIPQEAAGPAGENKSTREGAFGFRRDGEALTWL